MLFRRVTLSVTAHYACTRVNNVCHVFGLSVNMKATATPFVLAPIEISIIFTNCYYCKINEITVSGNDRVRFGRYNIVYKDVNNSIFRYYNYIILCPKRIKSPFGCVICTFTGESDAEMFM